MTRVRKEFPMLGGEGARPGKTEPIRLAATLYTLPLQAYTVPMYRN